jgi:hypothetical protein
LGWAKERIMRLQASLHAIASAVGMLKDRTGR